MDSGRITAIVTGVITGIFIVMVCIMHLYSNYSIENRPKIENKQVEVSKADRSLAEIREMTE